MYEIVMPQLSDSMEEGKLVSWKVKPGDSVKTGDVIAEVESDKAIMEVQTFKKGTVKELLVKEGDEAPVGTVIARIDVGSEQVATSSEKPKENEERSKEQVVSSSEQLKSEQRVTSSEQPNKNEEPNEKNVSSSSGLTGVSSRESEKSVKTPDQVRSDNKPHPPSSIIHHPSAQGATVSPKARAKAAAYGIDIDTLMEHRPQQTLHAEDIDAYLNEHYFTPKALKLMKMYHIDPSAFTLDHKIDTQEMRTYIDTNEIPLPKPLTPMQKAVIANVTASAGKPVYRVYEHLDATELLKHEAKYSMTVLLVKLFAQTMMQFDHFRAQLHEDAMQIFPNASIAVAVADEESLYMPVIKDANRLTLHEIAQQLLAFKTKLKNKSFTAEDFVGSTFGISNLGMFGIERFDAMINKNDAAIVAVGATVDDRLSVTFTVDHRLINGYEAAEFVQTLKEAAKDPKNFKE